MFARNKVHQQPTNARGVVREILSSTSDHREVIDAVASTIKERQPKLPKVPAYKSAGVQIAEAKGYFWVKEPASDKITEVNNLILVEGREAQTRATLGKIDQLIKDHPMPMVIKKKEMIPLDPKSTVPFFHTIAGGNVKDPSTGEKVLTHEYAHNSLQNKVYGLCHR